MLVCIDAGHGLTTAGKRCMKAIDPAETREWVLNHRIADKLQVLLEAYNVTTMRVDDTTGKVDIPLADRCEAANEAKADFYLSIHHNAGIGGGSGGGIVVFTAKKCQQKSRDAQQVIYRHLIRTTGLRGNRSNPTPSANFYVLRNTRMPAVLVEHGFMDSTHDTPIILTEDFAAKAARGLADALAEFLGLEKKQEDGKEEEDAQRPAAVIASTTLPPAHLGVALVDCPKRDVPLKRYCTGGFWGLYKENGQTFTLPAGHLRGRYMAGSLLTLKYCEERGAFDGDTFTFDASRFKCDTINPFCGKAVTTLTVSEDGTASISELTSIPTGCRVALSGLPVVRGGAWCSSAWAVAQGFDKSCLRPTMHIFCGLRDGDPDVHIMRVETRSANLLDSREAYDLFSSMGYRDVLKMDGGGSEIYDMDGPAQGTAGNRRICSVLYDISAEAPAEKPPWYEPYMEKAKGLGLMDGTRPNDTVTRAELAVMLCELADRAGVTES